MSKSVSIAKAMSLAFKCIDKGDQNGFVDIFSSLNYDEIKAVHEFTIELTAVLEKHMKELE